MQFYAQNEQNFNAVERILYYTDLPSEGDYTKPDDPAPSWPEKGEIQFKDVDLAYREGLPLVLKGVSFSVRPGEKVRNHRWSYERAALTRVTHVGWHCWSYRGWEELAHASVVPVCMPSRIVDQPLTHLLVR